MGQQHEARTAVILFTLRCGESHEFDAWFPDGGSFDAQAREGSVVCPVCGDNSVEKAPMAPRISKPAATPASKPEAPPAEAEGKAKVAAMDPKTVAKFRRFVEDNCEHVGERFPEEARKIHYGETDERGIYGEASNDDAREMIDEGISIFPLPWRGRHDA